MKREGGFGWSELIAGILLILLGVFTFARPESMLSGLVVVYGIIAIALGIEDIVVYVRLSRFTGFGPMLSLIAGILSVMCQRGQVGADHPDAYLVHCPLHFRPNPGESGPADRQLILLLFLPVSQHSGPDFGLYDAL